MKRWRLMLALVLVALPAAGGLAAWRRAHAGYPDTVYYEQVAIISSVASTLGRQADVSRLWVDPAQLRYRRDRRGILVLEPSREVFRDGQLFTASAQGGQQLSGAALAFETRFCRSFIGGFGGAGRDLLSQAAGPVARLSLDGSPALRFDEGPQGPAGYSHTLWLDARTLVELQEQFAYPSNLTIYRYVHLERIAPGTLPADFFDPPRAQQSLWDRFAGWVRNHDLR